MRLIAKGNTAEIYEYRENKVCKLFYPGYPIEYINHEFHNAILAQRLGIRTAAAYEQVVIGERQGIIFDRVSGCILHDRILNSDKQEADRWVYRFSSFQKQFMDHRVKEAISYKVFLKRFAEDRETVERINRLPDDDCFLHGDYHMKNIMIDNDNNMIVIDMMNVCKDPKLYDVARTYYLLCDNQNVQRKYMEAMGCTTDDIRQYLDVILVARQKELTSTKTCCP